MVAWRYEIFSSHVENYFTRSLRSLVKYFSTLEDKFRISARPCNILYFLYNRTYNKILDRDWFSARLFVT